MVDDSGPVQADLEIRKLDLERYKARLDYRKFVLGSVFAAIAIAAIPPLFQLATAVLEYVKSEAQMKLDQQNKEAAQLAQQEQFREGYIKDFLQNALSQDIELRIRFAQYFADVSAESFRQGWIKYHDELIKQRDQTRKDIDLMEVEYYQKAQGPRGEDDPDVQRLVRNLAWANSEVGYAEKNRSVAAHPRTLSTPVIDLKDPNACANFAKIGFRGLAAQATDDDYQQVSAFLGIEPAVFRAFIKVETSASGFAAGRPIILFERQVFHRLTGGRYSESNPDISSPTAGGYGPGGSHQYDRLNQAMALDCAAALAATSWGKLQLMGTFYKAAGYPSVDEFVAAQMDSERKQLDAGAAWLKTTPVLLDALKNKDWAKFARIYNGANYAASNYDQKLASAYALASQH